MIFIGWSLTRTICFRWREPSFEEGFYMGMKDSISVIYAASSIRRVSQCSRGRRFRSGV